MPTEYPLVGSGYPSPISSALSQVARESAIAVPFRFDKDGAVATASGRANVIRQQILTLILTYRGERVMRPTYGSDLFDYLWEPNSPELEDIAMTHIRTLITSAFPSVTVTHLAVDSDDEDLVLTLDYQYLNDAPVQLTIPTRQLRESA